MILLRLASADHVPDLLADGRLASPTGYFNSTVALFFTRRAAVDRCSPPGASSRALLRGLLIAVAAASLQLAVIGQSRGWLFTLPIVAIAVLFVVRDRLRRRGRRGAARRRRR